MDERHETKKSTSENGMPMMENIPFKHVKYDMFMKLANKLDPDNLVRGNNWRLMADRLGYSTQDIFVFESQQTAHGRNTIKVLLDYSEKHGSTVNELYHALEEIERPDALDELKEGIPEIEKRYLESLQQEKRHQDLMENECVCPSCEPGQPSFPSYNCHKHSMPVKNYNILGNYATHHSQMMHMSHAPKNYQRHASVDSVHYPSIRLPSYDHQSPEFKRQKSMPPSDSMVVRGHDSHSQAFRDMEPMDHSPSIREDRVPPHVAIMRENPRYNMQNPLSSGMPALNPSSHHQNGDGIFRHPVNNHRPGKHPPLKLEIPNQLEMFDFMSPSPTPSTPSTPLDHLHKLANDTTFQPNEGYQKMLEMKRREELLQGKASSPYGNGPPEPYQQHTPPLSSRDCSYVDSSSSSIQGSAKVKSIGPPNTFPMRLKTNPQALPKSVSVPRDMKLAECKKAFRHIKVFVTYTADDRKHTQRVLNLCKCLEKNGFTCCVDIFHRKLPIQDRHDWYMNRFDEADFILVVVSNKYRMEVDSCEMENDADDSDSCDSDREDNRDDRPSDRDDRPHRLHTKHIYRLMYREYVQTGQRSMRFVPLIFPGMDKDLIPQWMLDTQNRLFYVWPGQYKDLLWMLTKPENRVPEHLVPSGNRCINDNDNEKVSSDTSELSVEDE